MHQGQQNGRPLLKNGANYNDSLAPASARTQGNNGSFAPLTDAASLRDNGNAGQSDEYMLRRSSSRNSRKTSSSSSRRRRKGSKIGAWKLLTSYMRDANKRPAVFALFVCLMTYMFNQVDRYLIGILAEDMQKAQGWGPTPANGEGSQYELLAGPIFTIIYLPAGIPVAWLADRFHHKRATILAIALFIWSLSCVLCGFSTNYWQVAVCRFMLALAESACTPLAGSLISDRFPKETRATALGIYNWGIYTGFSLAQGAANIMTEYLSWRVVWWTFGFAGIFWVPFVLGIKSDIGVRKVTHQENERRKRSNVGSINGSENNNPYSENSSENNDRNNNTQQGDSKIKILAYFLSSPSIILLFIASLIRNAGGYVWAYNTTQFFENVKGQSKIQIAEFMQWIPLIGGSLGAVLGGYISDRYVANAPSWRRIVILVGSNLLAAPFAFLALWLPAPYGYLCLIPSNVIGEMWVGITLALVLEISPGKLKTTAVSIYFFFIGIAGFFPYFVTPIRKLVDSYTVSLMILFPGLYVVSSALFLLTLFTIQRDKRRAEEQNQIVRASFGA